MGTYHITLKNFHSAAAPVPVCFTNEADGSNLLVDGKTVLPSQGRWRQLVRWLFSRKRMFAPENSQN